MDLAPVPLQHRWKKTVASPHLWIAVALLAVATLLHYLTPQRRLLSPPLNAFLDRHAVERILFVLPVIVTTHAYRWRGGVFTLALAVLIMLPRAIWISSFPVDALIETVAAAGVGSLAIWTIEAQAREKALHQKAASRLQAINAVTAIVTGSLDLQQILVAALDKVLEVMDLEAGLIFSLDTGAQELLLVAHRGVPEGSIVELGRLELGAGVYGQVVQSGELAVVQDACQNPPAMQREGLRTQVVVPLKSKGQARGVLVVATQSSRRFLAEELELLTAIGNEIGVAVENARLYKRMRFYARQVVKVQEEERERIARELHDETIQMLIVISRRLELLATLSGRLPQDAQQILASSQELIRDTQRGVRLFARGLRPPTLDHLGLVAALRGLANDLTKKDGIETEFKMTGETRRLTPEKELALFRIVQEALNNIRRHSEASQVTIQLAFCPDKIRMVIDDNGCGFDAPERLDDLVPTGRLGLIGMDERVWSLDGTLVIHSEPGRGTVVTVDIPVQSGKAGSSAQKDRP